MKPGKWSFGLVSLIITILFVACTAAPPQATNPPETDAGGSAPTETVSDTAAVPEETETTSATVETADAPDAAGNTPAEAEIAANVEQADAETGAQLFNQTLIPACRTCHLQETTVQPIAPGLNGFREVAATRVEGQGPYTYAYNSILYANQHIVEGYESGIMPAYDGILSEQEVYDLIAYIWTLEAE